MNGRGAAADEAGPIGVPPQVDRRGPTRSSAAVRRTTADLTPKAGLEFVSPVRHNAVLTLDRPVEYKAAVFLHLSRCNSLRDDNQFRPRKDQPHMFTTRELLAFLEAMNNMAIALETSVALSSAQCDTLANTARFWEGQALRKLNDIYTAQKKARARNQKKKAGQTPSLSLTKTPPPLG